MKKWTILLKVCGEIFNAVESNHYSMKEIYSGKKRILARKLQTFWRSICHPYLYWVFN